MFKNSRILYILLLITLNMTFVIKLFGGFRFNMAFSDLILPFALLSLLVQIRKEKDSVIFKYCLTFFLLISWIIISGVNSVQSNEILSFGVKTIFSETIKTLICILYFWLGYNALKKISQSDLIKSWFASVVIFVVFGIIISIFYNNIYPILDLTYNGYYYFTGTDSDSNHAATFLFISFFAFGFFDYLEKTKSSRRLFIIVSVISIFGIILTTSRSGLIALIVGCMIMFIVQRKTARSAIMLFLIFVVIVLSTITIDSYMFKGLFLENIYYKVKSIEDGFNVRTGLSLSALNMGNDNPIFGVGRGNFSLNSNEYFTQLNQTYINDIPHNTILGIYAELGILGVVLFSFPALAMIYTLIKYIKRSKGNYDINISNFAWLIAGISSVIVQSFVLNIENRRFLWFLTGLLIYTFENSLISFSIDTPKVDSIIQKVNRPTHILLTVVVVLLLGYNLKDTTVSVRSEFYKESFTYKYPYQTTSKSEELEVTYYLSMLNNMNKTPQLKVDIVESLDSKEVVLDSYNYISVNGQIKRKVRSTMENSSILIKFTMLDKSSDGFSFKPIGLDNDSYYINIDKSFLFRNVVYETEYYKEHNNLSSDRINLDYENKIGADFGGLIEFRGIDFSEAQNNILIMKFKTKKEIDFNYQFICFAYPDNIHLINEQYFERGYILLNPRDEIYTSEWKSNSEYSIAVRFPEHGIYNIEFGFMLPYENNINYLTIKNSSKYLNIGNIAIDNE